MDAIPPFPKPSILQRCAAVLVIVGSLFLVGTCAIGLFANDPHAFILALALTPWPLLVAGLQYHGTFRYGKTSTAWALALVGFFTAVLGLASLQLLRYFWMNGFNDFDLGIFNAILLTIFLLGCGVCLSNWFWFHALKKADEAILSRPKFQGISLKELLLLVLAIGFVSGIAGFAIRDMPVIE